MSEAAVKEFWEAHSCGDSQVGGLRGALGGDYTKFFDTYDALRYRREGHILRCLDEIDFKGKQVLDIGLGQGADSEQIIRRGAIWTGFDLTQEAVDRTRTRLELKQLPYADIRRGSMLEMPFCDQSFDIVFSHGALPCVENIQAAQREFARVLKPNGRVIVMLYAKGSLNYLLSISVLRRLGLFFLFYSRFPVGGIYREHVKLAHEMGLWKYLRLENFIHHNTDGPLNPYIRVHSEDDVRKQFSLFRVVRMHKEFMHAPPLPVSALPFAHLMGWHLWAHMEKK